MHSMLLVGIPVAFARVFVDDTRWNHTIPIKVNVFPWRLYLNKLPSTVKLDRRGVQIDSILC